MADHTTSEEIEERFQVLEAKILHQERTIEDLNSVVIRQQAQVDKLEAQVEKLEQSVDDSRGGAEPGEEPPPPHY